MLIVLLSAERDLAVTGQDVVRLFYPDSDIVLQPAVDYEIMLNVSVSRLGKTLTGSASLKNRDTGLTEEASTDAIPVAGDERNQQKRLVKLALFRLLCRYQGTAPGPWGILTGIRPTKIVHRLLDLAWEPPEINEYLINSYDMAPGKAALLTGIALKQRPFLLAKDQAKKLVSIYVGIPFCPTRCAYCSFPSYSVETRGGMVESFLKALKGEIEKIGAALTEQGKKVQTIYIGGGTPTVLDTQGLRALLASVRTRLVGDETSEVTLEAGRPDTVTEEKLKAALEYGVTRLSINPQSMNRHTLLKIGRRHTPEQVVESVEMARRFGFGNINMDIIIGLPGESEKDVDNTLREIGKIRPENLTVHTLAVKRASKIKEDKEYFHLPSWDQVEKMLEIAAEGARGMGMEPYYLYRQKRMVGPQENIGYARNGFDCIYNIQIIDERQTVIGLGGGAGSKFVDPETWRLTSHYNPKDPETYITRIDDLIARKISMLQGNSGLKLKGLS